MLMMYRISNMSFSTAPIHTRLSPKNFMLPYFLLQAQTMCLRFWARKTIGYISSLMHFLLF